LLLGSIEDSAGFCKRILVAKEWGLFSTTLPLEVI
jgi:hypothetical protein